MSTLVEKAKSSKSRRRSNVSADPDKIDLALALLRDEVTLAQCQSALGFTRSNNNAVYHLWTALREGIRSGLVTVERRPDSPYN